MLATDKKRPITLLALGDSYTIGEAVEVESRWPNQLANLLQPTSVSLDSPHIVAKTGWTTSELKAGIDAETLLEHYDFVTLLIGVNNQYRGLSVDNYRQELSNLIDFALTKNGQQPRRLILLSIPDWGVTPFAEGRDREKIAADIDLFNFVKRQESTRAKTHFVDITDITRQANSPNSPLLAEDGLHPSAVMYHQWAKRVQPIILQELCSH